MLQRLIYFSARGAQDFDLDALVAASAERNRAVGVTGLLVADANAFLQVLEGPRDTVSALFQRISTDPRHERVTLSEVAEIAELAYPQWGMSGLHEAPRVAALWAQADSARPFDPWALRAQQIRDFLRLVTFDQLRNAA